MTTTTAVFGLTRPDDSTLLADLATAITANANTIEAALVRGGIAPPAAQDLATLAGRVTALEAMSARVTALEAANTARAAWPYAILRQSIGQNLTANTWADLALATEDADTGNAHSTAVGSNVRWTCPAGQAGLYEVVGNIVTGNGAATTIGLNVRIAKSGTALPNAVGVFGRVPFTSTGPKLVTLAVGDTLTVQGWADAATTTAVFADSASGMTVRRVQ